MANTYEQILALANKNNMGLSNTIKRDYGIPLDYSSVQETYDAALAYAKTSTLAYIGQPISVGDTLYVVTDEAGGYLKAVGTAPVGDDVSISVAEDGKISLKGFAAAANATLPRKSADGSIEWVPVNAIVTGDGNTKTIVTSAEDSAITVTPSYDGLSDTYTYTLDVTLPAIPDYTVTKETAEGQTIYKVTKDGTPAGEAIIVPDAYDDTVLSERVSTAEANIADADSRLDIVEERVEGFFAAVENPDDVVNTLAEIQKYITDDAAAATTMTTNIGNNTEAIAVLNGTGTGSVSKTVNDAIAAQAALDEAKYATKMDLATTDAKAAAAATKSEVEAALAGKADETSLNNYYTKDESYNKDAVDALLAGIKGEYGETADSVAGALNTHKQESSDKFTAIEAKNAEQDAAIAANTTAIEAINNESTGILAKAKADAATKVNALADGAVATNASNITALDGKITTINGNISSINSRVAVLEQEDTNIKADIAAETAAREALAETVAGHTVTITGLQTKDTELTNAIQANTDKFNNYYTSTQTDAAIAAAIEDIDSSAINDAIEQNRTDIAAEITRATQKENELAGLISTNVDSIKTNASGIAALEATLNAVIANDDGEALNSIKELAVWVTEHESEVLPKIDANIAAIEKLNGAGEGSVQKIVADAINNIPVATALVAGLVKASDEITVAADGAMHVGCINTDKLIQGSNILVLNGGSATDTK